MLQTTKRKHIRQTVKNNDNRITGSFIWDRHIKNVAMFNVFFNTQTSDIGVYIRNLVINVRSSVFAAQIFIAGFIN